MSSSSILFKPQPDISLTLCLHIKFRKKRKDGKGIKKGNERECTLLVQNEKKKNKENDYFQYHFTLEDIVFLFLTKCNVFPPIPLLQISMSFLLFK